MKATSEHDLSWYSDPAYDRSGNLVKSGEDEEEPCCKSCSNIPVYSDELVKGVCPECRQHCAGCEGWLLEDRVETPDGLMHARCAEEAFPTPPPTRQERAEARAEYRLQLWKDGEIISINSLYRGQR